MGKFEGKCVRVKMEKFEKDALKWGNLRENELKLGNLRKTH